MRPDATRFLLPAFALVALGNFGCQYEAATAACYDVAGGIGDRLHQCGYVASPEAGEQAVHDSLTMMGLDCDISPTGIRDSDELYMECLPQLMTYDCSEILDSVPPPCEDQIVYRGS